MSERTLLLLRHAKSSWDDPAMADFDRPLNRRGLQEAEAVAALIAERGDRPSRVLCSPARRTRETLEPLLGWLSDTPVSLERRIYEASTDALLSLLRAQPAPDATILMIGHNPGFEDLARSLCPDGDRDALKRLRRKYPPAGLATITFEASTWSAVGPGTGKLVSFHSPAE